MSGQKQNFFIAMASFLKEYRNMSFKAVKEYNFTPAEIDVLMFLFNNAPLDTAKDITKYKGISKSLVCRSVDSLVKKEFISTVTDRNDRRIVHLIINENASDVVKKLKESKEQFIEEITKGIEEKDIENFIKVLNSMMNNVEKTKTNSMVYRK